MHYHFNSAMPANKTKTMEEIEKESDMSPEFEFDPILDIIKEADEKLKLIKTTSNKNEKAKVKKGKSSKGKVTKGKKGKVPKNKDDREASIDAPNDSDSSQAQKSTNGVNTKSPKKGTLEKSGDSNIISDTKTKAKTKSKGSKTKKHKAKKEKKAKRKPNKISQRISLALRLQGSKLDDTTLKVIVQGLIL